MLANTCLHAAKPNFCHDIVTHESFISRSAGSLHTTRAFSKVGTMGVTDTQHSAWGHWDRTATHPIMPPRQLPSLGTLGSNTPASEETFASSPQEGYYGRKSRRDITLQVTKLF